MPSRGDLHLALGTAIRQLREEASLSQEALAARSGLHRTYVGGIERGERNPSFANLVRLADALDVRLSDVIIVFERERQRRPGKRGAGTKRRDA